MNILEFQNKKARGEKISMLTCYDASFARIINQTKIDSILVGDSAAMTMLGLPNTLPIDVKTLAIFTAAVARSAPDKLIIGDLPFLSYRKSLSLNVTAAEKLMKAGAHAVKLEGATGNLELIKHLVQSGVPVMGHVGLTPQSIHQLGGFKVQGREEKAAKKIFEDAMALQDAGCFSIVFECIPSELAGKMTKAIDIPTIGIGAGPDVDGQVLVLQDLLGMNPSFSPKFVRKYFDGFENFKNVLNQFHDDVQKSQFPNKKESYE